MSSVHIDLNARRPRFLRYRAPVLKLLGKSRAAPGRLLARLFLSVLAGILALHFWRDRDR